MLVDERELIQVYNDNKRNIPLWAPKCLKTLTEILRQLDNLGQNLVGRHQIYFNFKIVILTFLPPSLNAWAVIVHWCPDLWCLVGKDQWQQPVWITISIHWCCAPHSNSLYQQWGVLLTDAWGVPHTCILCAQFVLLSHDGPWQQFVWHVCCYTNVPVKDLCLDAVRLVISAFDQIN